MFVSHFRGLSVTFDGLYTPEVYTLCADEGDPFTNFFVISLLSEWKSNRPHPPAASHFVRVRSRDAFSQMEPFSDLKNVHLNAL